MAKKALDREIPWRLIVGTTEEDGYVKAMAKPYLASPGDLPRSPRSTWYATCAKATPAGSSWRPKVWVIKQDPNPSRQGKRRSSGSDDSDDDDGDEGQERKMSSFDYLLQADLSQEWWVRIVVSSDDLGFTAEEMLAHCRITS